MLVLVSRNNIKLINLCHMNQSINTHHSSPSFDWSDHHDPIDHFYQTYPSLSSYWVSIAALTTLSWLVYRFSCSQVGYNVFSTWFSSIYPYHSPIHIHPLSLVEYNVVEPVWYIHDCIRLSWAPLCLGWIWVEIFSHYLRSIFELHRCWACSA
jgi:hypothetical protein